jgi:hypothetical protein
MAAGDEIGCLSLLLLLLLWLQFVCWTPFLLLDEEGASQFHNFTISPPPPTEN